jgi:hypothetical protein
MSVPFSANMSVNAWATGLTPPAAFPPSQMIASGYPVGLPAETLVDAVEQLEEIAFLLFLGDFQQVELLCHERKTSVSASRKREREFRLKPSTARSRAQRC